MFSELGYENIGHCRETVGSYTTYRKHIRHSPFKIKKNYPIYYIIIVYGVNNIFSYAYDRKSTEGFPSTVTGTSFIAFCFYV